MRKRKQKNLGVIGVFLCFTALLGVLYAKAAPSDFMAQAPISQTFTILESEGGTYFGPVLELLYAGAGEFQHLEGGVYQGEFASSRRSGQGTFLWPNGDRYTGAWSGDAMTEGTYRFADGRAFTGTFTDNRFSSGAFTVGDAASAYGLTSLSITYAYGEVTQIAWKAENGSAYDGELTGWAVIHYADGSTYDGEVKNGSRNGNGTYRWKSNGEVTAYYEGQWSGGQMSGTGAYHYTGNEYPCLKGSFVNGKPDGTAVYYKAEGNAFDTTWKNGTCSKVAETQGA